MDVKDAVLARKSIRAFDATPVSRKVLEEILETALRAPSWGNTQPWKFTIVGGDPLTRIQEEYVRLFGEDVPPNSDFEMPTEFSDAQKVRYQGLGKGLFQALGIEREDTEKRNTFYENMMRALGAPHVIYLQLDKGFNPYALMDGGTILQTIALLAVEKGLGTCFLAQAVRYPDVVRKHAGIPPDQMLVMGMAIGTPIQDHPVNLFHSERGKPEEFFRFLEIP
ncbi:MAG: nitroreductase [Desulfobacteraceae bacterium]|nr:nitroreductase [Desulfobacteraceae bacterium]